MKKTLPILFAAWLLSMVCCLANGSEKASGTVLAAQTRDSAGEKTSPPAMLTMAGGVLVLLGLIRRKQSA